MSDLPTTNGEEARVWMERAWDNAQRAGFYAGEKRWHMACHLLVQAAELAVKAAHVTKDTPFKREQHIRGLLSTCPAPAIRESVHRSYDRNSLDKFSKYYFSVYPDGEDADEVAYVRCSQVSHLIVRCVETELL